MNENDKAGLEEKVFLLDSIKFYKYIHLVKNIRLLFKTKKCNKINFAR